MGTSNYSEPEGISLLRRYTRRRGASDETICEAIAQVELHLFHLASDVVELSFFIPGVLSALVEAQEEARLAIQRLSNPDPNDETTIAGHTLFSRGGRPVTADPVKDFRGHSDAFVMRTLRTTFLSMSHPLGGAEVKELRYRSVASFRRLVHLS